MPRRVCLALLLTAAIYLPGAFAQNQADLKGNGTVKTVVPHSSAPKIDLDRLIAHHAAVNDVPEALVRRIIKRESGGNPRAISKGNYGLMQIRLGTARALGYRGGIEGLLDADTNMTYAVKYLAGAYRAAEGDLDRAVHYYAAGYYYVAKRKGLLNGGGSGPLKLLAFTAAQGEVVSVAPKAIASAPMPPRRPAAIELVAVKTEMTTTGAPQAEVSEPATAAVDLTAAETGTPPIVDRFSVK